MNYVIGHAIDLPINGPKTNAQAKPHTSNSAGVYLSHLYLFTDSVSASNVYKKILFTKCLVIYHGAGSPRTAVCFAIRMNGKREIPTKISDRNDFDEIARKSAAFLLGRKRA